MIHRRPMDTALSKRVDDKDRGHMKVSQDTIAVQLSKTVGLLTCSLEKRPVCVKQCLYQAVLDSMGRETRKNEPISEAELAIVGCHV